MSKRVRDDHSINWWSSISGHPSRIRKLYPTASPTGRTLRQENNVPIYFQMGKMEGFFPTLGKCLGRRSHGFSCHFKMTLLPPPRFNNYLFLIDLSVYYNSVCMFTLGHPGLNWKWSCTLWIECFKRNLELLPRSPNIKKTGG